MLEFAVTLNVTVPLPDPLAPAVTVIHVAPLVAVHEHPLAAETVTLLLPAVAPTDALVGVTV